MAERKRPTDDEIRAVIEAAEVDTADWNNTYGEGVVEALEWVLGRGENPIEEN